MQKVLVTGADGFVGKRFCHVLATEGFYVRAAVWSDQHFDQLPDVVDKVCVGDIGRDVDWATALKDIDVIVHLAARVHMMRDEANDPLAEYCRVNVDGTKKLAEAAMKAGVRRFIFLSTIKVNGEEASVSKPFTEEDGPNPQDDYAVSKLEAENALRGMESQEAFKVTIIRSPLIYGPGVKANFKKLLEIAGSPLPFKNIKNQRSFIFLDNLVSAIKGCVTHPLAEGKIFLVSDGQDASTSDLIKIIAMAKNKKAKLFFIPLCVLKVLARVVRKEESLMRLTGSLVVDSSKIRKLLSWNPPFTLEEGIKQTVEGCRS